MRPLTLALALAFLIACGSSSATPAPTPMRPVSVSMGMAPPDPQTGLDALATTTTTAPPPPPTTQPEPPPTTRIHKQRTAPVPTGSAAEAIARYFPDNYQSAYNVASCESTGGNGLDPGAISPGGGNLGLFQINYVHADQFKAVTGKPYHDGALDADANAEFARWLYDQSGGWGPWSCRWAA